MKLGTLRTNNGTAAVLISEGTATGIVGVSDVGALLNLPDWRTVAASAAGTTRAIDTIEPSDWAPVVPKPGKILCVGLNYRNHILEMGRVLPDHPTFFAKYPEALVGAFDDIQLPAVSDAVDWEGELAVVIGRPARNLSEQEAGEAIAGYAVLNDISMRDYQNRTLQWMQGKTFESSSPFGPYLVTADEFEMGAVLRTSVDDEHMQESSTSDLVFKPAKLISYFSEIVTLNPGDVISTGTPGGVGHARKPPRYLVDGSIVQTSIDGLGTQRNRATTATVS